MKRQQCWTLTLPSDQRTLLGMGEGDGRCIGGDHGGDRGVGRGEGAETGAKRGELVGTLQKV